MTDLQTLTKELEQAIELRDKLKSRLKEADNQCIRAKCALMRAVNIHSHGEVSKWIAGSAPGDELVVFDVRERFPGVSRSAIDQAFKRAISAGICRRVSRGRYMRCVS